MKSLTPRWPPASAIATALLGLSVSAMAANAPSPDGAATQDALPAHLLAQHMAQRTPVGPNAGPAKMDLSHQQGERGLQKMQKRVAEHQARLKDALQLTPAQEPAWLAFVAATTPKPPQHRRMQREDLSQLTTPQRLDRMQARMAERQAEMARRFDATRSLYAALTPDQQKRFDAQPQGGFHRAGLRGEGGRHGHSHQKGDGQHGPRGGFFRHGGPSPDAPQPRS